MILQKPVSEFSLERQENSDASDPLTAFKLPSFLITVAISCGISGGYFCTFYLKRDAAISAILLLALFFFFLFYCKATKGTQHRLILSTLLLAAFAGSFFHARLMGTSALQDSQSCTIERVEQCRFFNRIIFNTGNHSKGIAYLSPETQAIPGDCLIPVHPLEKLELSEKNLSLLRSGIHYSAVFSDKTTIKREHAPSLLYQIKQHAQNSITSLYPKQSRGLILSLISGTASWVPFRTLNDFKRAGALHILAASGTHAAIAASLPLLLCTVLGLRKKVVFIIAALFVAAYLTITDSPVSLLRACIMFWITSTAVLLDRERMPLNLLFLSAAVILVLFPFDLYSLSFHLSFFATLGLILACRRCEDILSPLPEIIRTPLAITLSAQIMILPILSVVFREINFTGFVSNLLLVPLFNLILILSMISVALFFVNTGCAELIAWANDFIIRYSVKLVGLFSSAPGHFPLSEQSIILILPFIFIVCIIIFKTRSKISPILIIAAISASYVFVWLNTPTLPEQVRFGNLSITLNENSAIIEGEYDQKFYPQISALFSTRRFNTVTLFIDGKSPSLWKMRQLLGKIPVDKIFINSIAINRKTLQLLEGAEQEEIMVKFDLNP